MGRPVSQHLGAAAVAAAEAVDVLTVATAAVGLPPMDDGAVVDDGVGPPVMEDGEDVLLLLLLMTVTADSDGGRCGGCGETDDDECLRLADEVCCNCKGGGLEEDEEDVCGGSNSDCGCAKAVCKTIKFQII